MRYRIYNWTDTIPGLVIENGKEITRRVKVRVDEKLRKKGEPRKIFSDVGTGRFEQWCELSPEQIVELSNSYDVMISGKDDGSSLIQFDEKGGRFRQR